MQSKPVPPEVYRVEGCNCGGLNMHVVSCSIFDMDPQQAMANTDEARERLREYTAELNRQAGWA